MVHFCVCEFRAFMHRNPSAMHPSVENFHPLHLTPSHTGVPNSVHCCAKFTQDCAELVAREMVPNLFSAVENYFADVFNHFEIFGNLL